MYYAIALGAVRSVSAKEPQGHSVGQDPKTNLIELRVWLCFLSDSPFPPFSHYKKLYGPREVFCYVRYLVYHLWQSQGGGKVCVSERRRITAPTMLHIDSQNCRTSTIVLWNMPRQGEALTESGAPPATALWHMVFKALFTHNREHFTQALKLS